MEIAHKNVCIPTVSRLWELGTTPTIDTVPWDGLNPSIPQKDAGALIHPKVSVPVKCEIFIMKLNWKIKIKNKIKINQPGTARKMRVKGSCKLLAV